MLWLTYGRVRQIQVLLCVLAFEIAGVCMASGASLGGEACNSYDIEVSTTPVPEQDPLTLKDARDKMGRIPPSADILLLGDSLARKLTPDIAKQLFPGKRVWNYGVGGDQTQNVLWRMRDKRLSSVQPSKIIVFVGTNNLATTKQSGCAIAAGMAAVVTRARELWPNAKVILLPILPRGPDFHFADASRHEANRLSGALSVDEVQFTCGGYGKPVRPDVNYACSPEEVLNCPNFEDDNIHLRAQGYTEIVKYISP